MASTIQDVMTPDLVACPSTASIGDAARLMRDRHIGDVIVTNGDQQIAGIVTDRDLVVRCLADGASADAPLGDACSADLACISPTASTEDAAGLMRERSLRRLPVVDAGRAIGIVSLGDLAIASDPNSALGNISAAAPNV